MNYVMNVWTAVVSPVVSLFANRKPAAKQPRAKRAEKPTAGRVYSNCIEKKLHAECVACATCLAAEELALAEEKL